MTDALSIGWTRAQAATQHTAYRRVLGFALIVQTALGLIALAAPVWVLLSTSPDWRFLPQGDTTDWYPTMRLFRQRAAGQWDTVIDEVIAALRR